MRTDRFAFVPCLLLVAVLLLPFEANAQGQSQVSPVAGHITSLVPQDTVVRERQAIPAARDMALLWLDVVKTDSAGRVRIQLADGSELSLSSDAQLQIVQHDARRQRTILELLYGRLLASAMHIRKSSGRFEVSTPTAVVGVVGTKFGVKVDPQSTDVLCKEGTVRVRNADPGVVGEVVLRSGEFTHVERGKPPLPPAPASPERIRAGEDATAIPNTP
jgi:ferric-dicitrate binding protein FerR (iron transport regulator)